MAYQTGGLIEASDFNDFRDQVQMIIGVGNGDFGHGFILPGESEIYELPTVDGGMVELVKSTEWKTLRTSIVEVAALQGSSVSLPPDSDFDEGELIRAHTSNDNTGDIDAAVTTITNNRLQIDPSYLTLYTSQQQSNRGDSWFENIEMEIEILFDTVDEARYFFNLSSEIQVYFERSGGSSSTENDEWDFLFNDVGSIVFNHSNMTADSGSAQGIGYYDLTSSYQLLYQRNRSTATNNQNIDVYGRTVDGPSGSNGDNGRRIRLRYELIETGVDYTNAMDGNLTGVVDIRRKGTGDLIAPAPANISVVTALDDLSGGQEP